MGRPSLVVSLCVAFCRRSLCVKIANALYDSLVCVVLEIAGVRWGRSFCEGFFHDIHDLFEVLFVRRTATLAIIGDKSLELLASEFQIEVKLGEAA